jgi:hypothetical protein
VSGSPGAGFVFTPSAALVGMQTLTYTAIGANVCGGIATTQVKVVAVPTVSIAPLPTTTYCPGSTPQTLTATPIGGTFSGPGVRNGNVFDPLLAGVGQHVLTYTAPGSICLAQAQTTVTVLPVIVVQRPADTTLCAASRPLVLTALPGGGTWAGPGVSGSPAAGFLFIPSVGLIGRQLLTYTAPGANMCGGMATVQVTVAATPTASIVPVPVATYCPGSPAVTLAGVPAGGTFSGPGVSGNSFSPGTAGVGQHLITYTYFAPGLDCPAVATTTIQVTPALVAQLPADTVLCGGGAISLALRALPAGGSWAGPGVSGSPAAGFRLMLPASAAGSYALTYTVGTGACAGLATRRIDVVPVPQFTASWEAASACPDNHTAPLSLRFTATSSLDNTAPVTVAWVFGDGSQGSGRTTEHTYAQGGTYQPRATLTYSGAGCQVSYVLAPITVQEQRVPNIITPNGDGDNDTFKPVFACAPHLRIYSRWGRLVYESAAYRNDWGAEAQPGGLYYYRLEAGSSPPVQGWLEVIK